MWSLRETDDLSKGAVAGAVTAGARSVTGLVLLIQLEMATARSMRINAPCVSLRGRMVSSIQEVGRPARPWSSLSTPAGAISSCGLSLGLNPRSQEHPPGDR